MLLGHSLAFTILLYHLWFNQMVLSWCIKKIGTFINRTYHMNIPNQLTSFDCCWYGHENYQVNENTYQWEHQELEFWNLNNFLRKYTRSLLLYAQKEKKKKNYLWTGICPNMRIQHGAKILAFVAKMNLSKLNTKESIFGEWWWKPQISKYHSSLHHHWSCISRNRLCSPMWLSFSPWPVDINRTKHNFSNSSVSTRFSAHTSFPSLLTALWHR